MVKRPVIGRCGGALMALLLGLSLAGGEERAQPPISIIFTPMFRIRVETSASTVGQIYSTWTDHFLQRLHRLLQWEIHPLPDRTLTLRLYPAEEGRIGELTAEQPVAGQVEQILSIYGVSGENRQALEELLVEMDLERQMISRMTPAALQKGIPVPPRWLSVGLARYLDSELRVQDARWVGDSMEAGVWPTLAEWVTWRSLPAGYSEEKSFSCQALAWILSRPTGSAGFQGLLDSLTMGRQLDSAQIAARLNFATVDEAEADWKGWLERQGRMVRFGMDEPRDLARRLRGQMSFTGDELARAGVPTAWDPTWADLIDYRGKLWVRKLTARKADSLRLMAIGKDLEFRELAAKAAAYLEKCGGNRHWPLSSSLRRQYEELAQMIEQYEQVVIQREAYVDQLESVLSSNPVPEYEEGLEKSALRDYVDRVESNLVGQQQ